MFYAAAAVALAWISVWGYADWLSPFAIAGTMGAAAFAVWSVRYRKALGTVLVGDTLVEQHQRNEVRIPVSDVTAIDYAWVPYSGGSLIVRGRSGKAVQLHLGSPDRIELGRMLRKRQPMLSFSPRVERELGYYE